MRLAKGAALFAPECFAKSSSLDAEEEPESHGKLFN